MKRAYLRIPLLCLAVALPATGYAQYEDLEIAESTSSGSSGNRFGLGIEAMLTSPFAPGAGASFIFDASDFRVQAIAGLAFVEDDNTRFNLGGRFVWVLHRTDVSDLAAGAGIGVSHVENEGPGDQTLFHLEGLVQIRFFVVSNVALSGSLGLGLVAGDGPTALRIGGQLTGIFGVAYYFE